MIETATTETVVPTAIQPQRLLEYKYGIRTNVRLTPADVECYAFRNKLQIHEGGLGTYGHCRELSNILWPKLIWHEWLERQIESLCESNYVSWAGCGASGKTYGASLFAMLFWAANPSKTAVVLTSTTAKMIRKRMWGNIQGLFRGSTGFPGNLVDSKMTLQSVRGDDKHSISAIAVAEGNTSKAVANIQGIHAERVMVIVDEATDTPEAAFEACTNLSKGCKEFKLLVIGNPASKFDPHGRFSTPKHGWGSVDIEDDEWVTERGVCLRFDGSKSPNFKAGRTLYPFLITKQQLIQAKEHEGENSPTFWKYTRGMWAPDGMVKTVLSESLIDKHDLRKQIIFRNASTKIASLDPAFMGGDRCILRFGRLGINLAGIMTLSSDEIIHISPNAMSQEPVHYQIANSVIEHCQKRGIRPEHFALDSSGEGGGLADIIQKTWGQIVRVEFGGKPSQKPVSEEDARPAEEVYDRKVSELWFSVRQWATKDKLGGLDNDTLKELCGRMFNDEKRKIVVERKSDMKKRTGRSPDLADAFVVMVELARQLGGEGGKESRSDKRWDNMVHTFDSLHTDENTYVEAPERTFWSEGGMDVSHS